MGGVHDRASSTVRAARGPRRELPRAVALDDSGSALFEGVGIRFELPDDHPYVQAERERWQLALERGDLAFACDAECQDDHWRGAALSERKELGSGVGLTLDARDFPRLVFTLDDAIGYYACDAAHCTGDDADWQLQQVELASDLPKDDIILWPNCTIDAWILDTPSLALGADGKTLRVVYQATDLSGGLRVIDKTKPSCLAGKDMVLSRMAVLH